MALFRKFFYKKPPDGLLEISERVYVFDCCFSTDVLDEVEYKVYVGGIVTQLREHFPDASFMVFNFREGENQSHIANLLSEYDMTVMDYPRHYEGCPLLTMEMIHHFLRSSESWLSLGHQNILLMHCERGGWPALAFMLAGLLIYRKQYTGEQKTLDMIYKQAPRELLQLLSPLNPVPSQLRYLQYVSRRNVGSEWPPLDRALTLDCIILRTLPNFDGEGGCRPIFRIYGQDPFIGDRTPKVLFSTSKKSKSVRLYKQADCELVKIDIHCHVQGDVVLECISLDDDLEREVMMFRVMFNTAFIRSNILMLNRDEIDILWDAKDRFPKDFRAEVLLSEMDTSASLITLDLASIEEKEGLPVEAFAKVQEIFSNVDWLDVKGDATLQVLQQITSANALQEKLEILSPQKAEIGATHVLQQMTSRNSLQDKSKTLSPHKTESGAIPQMPCPQVLKEKVQSDDSEVGVEKISLFVQKQQSAPLSQQSPDSKVQSDESKVRVEKTSPSVQKPQPAPLPQQSPDSKVQSDDSKVTVEQKSPSVQKQQSAPLPQQFPDSSTKNQKMQFHDLHVAVQRPSQPKIISQRMSPSSRSNPVSSSNSLQSSPAPVSRYHSAPSALGITALLQDHAAFVSSEVTRTVVSPPAPLLSSHTASGSSEPVGRNISSPALSSVLASAVSAPQKVSISDIPASSKTSTTIAIPLPPPLPQIPPRSPSCPQPPPPPPPPPKLSSQLLSPLPQEFPSSETLSMPTQSPLHHGTPLTARGSSAPVPPPPPSHLGTSSPSTSSDFDARSNSPSEHRLPLPSDTVSTKPLQAAAPPPPPPPPKVVSLTPTPPTLSTSPTPPIKKEIGTAGAPPPPPPPPCSGHGSATILTTTPAPPPPPQLAVKHSGPFKSQKSPVAPPAPPPPTSSQAGLKGPGGPPPQSKGNAPPPPANGIGGPLGGKGRGLARTTSPRKTQSSQVSAKRTSLKPLHWVKVTRAMQGSLWAENQKSDEASKAPEFDMSELESLFSAAVPASDRDSADKTRRSSLGPKSDKIHLIDLRRANNCEIMLTKVKIPLPDLMSSVLALDDSVLDVDQVDNLIKFSPTKEEMDLLKGYTGDRENLGKCEQFFLELMKIPRVESKLRVFSFKIQFLSQVDDLRRNLNIVNSASEEVRNSVKLKRIMQTILSLGNALNQGTARGSAIGFKLDSLLKLIDTRARNNKMTLMHYLCKVLADKLPELLDFHKDLVSLEPASKVQLKSLAEEMQAISRGLEKVEQELTASENDGPVSQTFHKTLKEFLLVAEADVRTLTLLYSGVGRNADALAHYFGEDPARCPFEQVVSTLLNFVKMFARAHEENCKQLELEKKKAQKETESEKAKLGALKRESDNLIQSPLKNANSR